MADELIVIVPMLPLILILYLILYSHSHSHSDSNVKVDADVGFPPVSNNASIDSRVESPRGIGIRCISILTN